MSNSRYTYTGLDTYHALELYHHGIKGMKWGIRRFQNGDGTLTELGKKRYGTVENMQKTRKANKDKAKKIAKTTVTTALGVAATAAAVYGGYAAYRAVKAAVVAAGLKLAKEATTASAMSKYKDILDGKLPKAITEAPVTSNGNVQGGIASLIPRSGAAASGISGLLKRKV